MARFKKLVPNPTATDYSRTAPRSALNHETVGHSLAFLLERQQVQSSFGFLCVEQPDTHPSLETVRGRRGSPLKRQP
jgi:hypothetical protein